MVCLSRLANEGLETCLLKQGGCCGLFSFFRFLCGASPFAPCRPPKFTMKCRTLPPSGEVPGLEEANAREPLVPWADPIGQRVVLGARVADACADPAALEAALAAFPGRQYAITYRWGGG